MINIAFIGVGGVGGYYGGKMSQVMDNEMQRVYFVARGEHFKVIQEKGLILKTNKEGTFNCKPYLVTDCINDLPMLDICFICVKGYDLERVVVQLQEKISDQTIIIPLLNGVDIYSRIRKVIKQGSIFPACVYIGTHIKEPGLIEQNGGACTLILGKDPNHLEREGDLVCQLFEKAHIKYDFTSEHIKEIWQKYIFIAAYGLVTASEHKTLGQVYEEDASSQVVKGIMHEIVKVGQAEGVELTDAMVEVAYQKARNFPYDVKTSFQRDYEAGKLDERELFGGTLLALAQKHQIDVPFITQVDGLINGKNR